MQAATLTAISKMQYLDPEELLMDEEDDVFGEGKHVFLAGAFLIDCLALTLLETLNRLG